jgi:hypothetical protein
MPPWPWRPAWLHGCWPTAWVSTTAVTTDTYQHVLPDLDHDAARRVGCACLPRSCSALDQAGVGVKLRDLVRRLQNQAHICT